MDLHVIAALMFLSSLGIQMPMDMPTVIYATPQDMKQVGNTLNAAVGLCLDGQVYLRDDVDLDTIYGMSVLVHELVHKVKQNDCPLEFNYKKRCKNENEAYAIQQQYLDDVSSKPGIRIVLVNPCQRSGRD